MPPKKKVPVKAVAITSSCDYAPHQKRKMAARRIAKALRAFALSVDRKKGKQSTFLDLMPYSGEVIDQFAKDWLKVDPKALQPPL